MSLYKPKGRKHWSYDFQINGVRFRGGTRTASKSAAREVERQARDDAARWAATGRPQPKTPLTATQAFERYAREKAEGRPCERDTDDQLARLLAHFGPAAPLSELADSDRIADFIARRRAFISDASVNREVELLRRVLRRARDVWKRDTGPLPDWSQLLLEEPEGRTRELTLEEEAALLQQLRPDFRPLVRAAILTGLRLTPLITLTWSQVDLDAGALRVRLKSRKPGGRLLELPITPSLRALLQGVKGQHPIYVFTYACRKSRARRRKGERYPFSKNGWRKAWAQALDDAGIADFRFHDLRHTAASRIVRSAGLRIGKEVLGHADIASTLRYAHVETNEIAQALEAAATAGDQPLNRRRIER